MTQLAVQNNEPVFEFGERGIVPRSIGDMMSFSTIMAKSKLTPNNMDTPEKVFVCCQFGAEHGLTPMQALRSIIVINNVPSWKGDAALAIALQSGKIEHWNKGFVGEGDDRAAFFETKRVGEPGVRRTLFSVKDAMRAGLWKKAGPWTQYPARMMHYRAMGFHLRDYFGDVLMGMQIAEEVADMPRHVTNTAERATVEPTADPLLDQLTLPAPDAAANVATEAAPAEVGA